MYEDPSLRNCKKIFVGGLGPQTTEVSLKRYFERYGTLQECLIMVDRDNKTRGFGFVTFFHESSVDKVFTKEAHTVDTKPVECKRAFPKEDGIKLP